MKTGNYAVIVGNVGTVWEGEANLRQATDMYRSYVQASKSGVGRGGNERVTLMFEGEPMNEFTPKPRRLRMTRKHKLAMMIHTAGCWHGDTGDGPVAMLSLSSTRKVHTEEHRRRLEKQIAENIQTCTMWVLGEAHDQNLVEIRRLCDLWEQVRKCEIGKEWLTFDENNRLNDELYDAGMLDNE